MRFSFSPHFLLKLALPSGWAGDGDWLPQPGCLRHRHRAEVSCLGSHWSRATKIWKQTRLEVGWTDGHAWRAAGHPPGVTAGAWEWTPPLPRAGSPVDSALNAQLADSR